MLANGDGAAKSLSIFFKAAKDEIDAFLARPWDIRAYPMSTYTLSLYPLANGCLGS